MSRLLAADPVLLAALCAGIVLRVWRFGDIPFGLHQDEASMAYDAYSLIHYGIDRNGFRFPVMLVSWGSGMYALASYLAAPFVGIFGLNVVAVRLPFLLSGVASIPLLYRLLADSFERRVARLGAVLLAFCPWHIMMSRWGLDSNLLPFVFLVATVLLLRSLERPWLLVPAAGAYALALYSYGTAYVTVPAFLVLAVSYGVVHRRWPRRTLLVAGAAGALVATPIVLYVLINNFGWESLETPLLSIPRLSGVPRYQTVGNVNVLSLDFLRRAADNLAQAGHLLRTQNDDLISNVLPEYGVLYWFSPSLGCLGLALLIGKAVRRQFQRSAFLLAWCAAALLLTPFLPLNINRANVALLPYVACVALAGALLWQYRSIAIALSLLFGVCSLGFAASYFGSYPWRASPAFFPSLVEAIRYASAQTAGEVCVTGRVNMPYIFVLFANAPHPGTFYRSVAYENPGAEFQRVASFDRYRFGRQNCPDSARVFVVPRGERGEFGRRAFSAKQFEYYTVLSDP
jgi:hypothetical protein